MPAKASHYTEQDQTEHDQFDSIIDTLIGDNAALIEAAFASRREGQRASTLERYLLTETLVTQLSDALAQTLADELAPRIMKALEGYAKGPGRTADVNVPSQKSGRE